MPLLATLETRLSTFQRWPPALRQKPKSLAEAGLYYTGVSDQVKCYQCGGGLRDWDPSDEPWEEHALWYPTCQHVVLLKGQAFVEEVRRRNELPIEARIALAEELMKKEPAISAVNYGLNRDDVKKAITIHLKEDRRGFSDLQLLINASLALAKSRKEGFKDSSEDDRFLPQGSNSTSKPEVKNEPPAAPSHESVDNGAASAAAAPALAVPIEKSIDTLCKVCKERGVSVVTLPCGHLCSCALCASSLKDCPMCREPLKGFVEAFWS